MSERQTESWTPDPYRVEIKENAKGEPSVNVRATSEDSDEAVEVAVTMRTKARRLLGLD